MIVVTVDLLVLMLDNQTCYSARPVAHAPRLDNALPIFVTTTEVILFYNRRDRFVWGDLFDGLRGVGFHQCSAFFYL
jgi:hypothetical protein